MNVDSEHPRFIGFTVSCNGDYGSLNERFVSARNGFTEPMSSDLIPPHSRLKSGDMFPRYAWIRVGVESSVKSGRNKHDGVIINSAVILSGEPHGVAVISANGKNRHTIGN